VADGEPGAEVWGCATDRQSAGIIYREAAAMVRASPHLSRVIEIVDSRNTLIHRASGSRYSILSSDSYRAEGINASAVLADEIHAMRDRRLLDALRYAGSARTQPMMIAISTAGYERGKSVAWEWWQDAEKVKADPSSNPTFFGKIFAADEEDDPFAESTWFKSNPSLGVTIPIESFRSDAEDARTNPSRLNSWMRYRLNRWTTSDVRWFDPTTWAACGDPPPQALEGRECWAGLDLASTTDITAVAFCFPADDGTYDIDLKCFIPIDTAAERELKDRVPYLQWIREGWIIGTDGDRCDYEVVEKYILDYAERHRIVRLAGDQWNAASTFTKLQQGGLEVVGYSMGIGSMSSPSKLLETLVAQKKIRHGNNPVLAWAASNVAVRTDANGNIAPCKAKSTERIDPIVASIMALSLASTAQIRQEGWDLIEL
jgi:phage terminase large subunit-like protein